MLSEAFERLHQLFLFLPKGGKENNNTQSNANTTIHMDGTLSSHRHVHSSSVHIDFSLSYDALMNWIQFFSSRAASYWHTVHFLSSFPSFEQFLTYHLDNGGFLSTVAKAHIAYHLSSISVIDWKTFYRSVMKGYHEGWWTSLLAEEVVEEMGGEGEIGQDRLDQIYEDAHKRITSVFYLFGLIG